MKTFLMNKSLEERASEEQRQKKFKEAKFFTQHEVENKELKEENEQLKEENEQLRKENEQLRKSNVVKDAEIKESIEKPKEIKSPEEDN